jgi:hypothetical protein
LIGIVGDTEFEFAFLGAQDDRLAVQSADHVKGRLGFTAQGQFQEVLLDGGFEGPAQLRLNGEEAVGRTEALQALVWAAVVIIFDPQLDALARVLEAGELGADQKLLPDRGPETLDLAQGHGVVWAASDMGHAVFLQLGFEAAGAAPGGVLAAVVGEHFARRVELANGSAIDLDDRFGGGTAEQVHAGDVAGMVIEVSDEIRVTAAQPEGENVRLPELVGRGALEEAGPGDIPGPLAARGRHELGLLQALADGAGTGREQKPAAQHLGDAFDPEGGMLLLERQDLLGDRRGQFFVGRLPAGAGLQGFLPTGLVPFDPAKERVLVHVQFLAQQAQCIPALQV